MTQIIKILGTGCPKCKTTTTLVEEVVNENNLKATIIKVEDIEKIMEYDVISTPAVVIDEKIVITGRVPKKTEILNFLTNPDKNTNTDNCCCCSDDNCC